jgi:hypothetical protein
MGKPVEAQIVRGWTTLSPGSSHTWRFLATGEDDPPDFNRDASGPG